MLLLEPKKKDYSKLIDFALKTSDHFSLVFSKDYENNRLHNNVYEKIKNYILNTKKMSIHPETGSIFDNSVLIHIKANPDLYPVFLITDEIYAWDGHKLPGDLCMYKNNTCWLRVIGHEKLCFINEETAEYVDFLEKNRISYWFH